MSARFKVACVQSGATADQDQSVAECIDLTLKAHAAGADLICLPEYFASLEVIDRLLISAPFAEQDHPVLTQFSDLAKDIGKWILLGSLAIETQAGKIFNRSYLLDAEGQVVARYDKVHLFDVNLDGEIFQESATIKPGDQAVVADLPWGRLGLSICYDLRFPHLYHALAQAKADFLATPAAFTKTTGEAHWHVLQRARAIETGCYVFAPCQYGDHGVGKPSFGHSLIVDPWGRILADAGEGPGVALADVDTAEVAAARQKIPALSHTRAVQPPDESEAGARPLAAAS